MKPIFIFLFFILIIFALGINNAQTHKEVSFEGYKVNATGCYERDIKVDCETMTYDYNLRGVK